MADKVIRNIYVDYDNIENYDQEVMRRLIGCKTTEAFLMIDVMERHFKKRYGKAVPVLSYKISIDSEDLPWITLTEPKIILER